MYLLKSSATSVAVGEREEERMGKGRSKREGTEDMKQKERRERENKISKYTTSSKSQKI